MTPRPDPIPGVEIRQRRRRDGTVYYVYRVRWKDPVTGKRLVETLDDPDDARDFVAHLRLAKRRGVLEELDQGRELLTEFAAEWWERFAKHNLERSTRETYASIWNRHLLPRVGHLQLRQITPSVVDQLKTDLQEDGLGAPTIRKAMSLLQAMFRQAVAWDRVRLTRSSRSGSRGRHASVPWWRSARIKSRRCVRRCRHLRTSC